MRCAIYARVSTEDQNCELQLTELRRYCAARGWQLVEEFVDRGWSGGKASRPELDRCMAAARKRQIDAILVWKLDRWGRGVAHCLSSIEELIALGVRWLAVTQNLDTDESNPVSRFLRAMLAAVAEFESALIKERVKAGLYAAKHRGVKLGRPKVKVDCRRARKLRKGGMSMRAIASELGVGKGTVERALANGRPEEAGPGGGSARRSPPGHPGESTRNNMGLPVQRGTPDRRTIS